MAKANALEFEQKARMETALDLLSKCRNDLSQFDDSGAHGEADLAHVVGRLRKVAGVLVPGPRLSSVLRSIDDALLVPAEESKAEKPLHGVFSGPFLSNRARRLIRVAEGVRDDIALGRLGNSVIGPKRSEVQGEPPPFAKWVVWCWTNRRQRRTLVILTLSAATVWFLLEVYRQLPRIHP